MAIDLGTGEAREASPAEVAASHSSWAKRLRAGAQRPVTLLRARAAEPRQGEPEALRAAMAVQARLRSSLWLKPMEGWRLLSHQCTSVGESDQEI